MKVESTVLFEFNYEVNSCVSVYIDAPSDDYIGEKVSQLPHIYSNFRFLKKDIERGRKWFQALKWDKINPFTKLLANKINRQLSF